MTETENNPNASPASVLAMSVRASGTGGTKLSKEHKQFNKLVKDIEVLRAQLAHWRDAEPGLAQRLAGEIAPLMARFRETRIQLAMLLGAAIESGKLDKRERRKAREIVCWHVSALLDAEPDEILLALHDQYAEVPYGQQQSAEDHLLRAVAADMSIEETARLVGESTFEAWEPPPAQRGSRNKGGAKSHTQEALRGQLAQGAGEAVRDIYRKLVSALHPDREPDAARRARKTALMQEANQAYGANDLLTLLGLQFQLEQLTPEALTSLARERLLQFNHLLGEQCAQMRDELAALAEPYMMTMADTVRGLTPEAVDRDLTREARELKRALKQCEADVAHFSDVRNIRRELADYRLGDLEARELAEFDELLFELEQPPPPPPPRRRRR